ncbi:hypothetical protein ACGFZQ_05125 [Streptomyces sp. NPDC048254]|uniref:hypothetical protein n=1 Tax=Streptomyces sp. NPDC048254 TaxID=3365525 RepID=UPI0037100BA1
MLFTALPDTAYTKKLLDDFTWCGRATTAPNRSVCNTPIANQLDIPILSTPGVRSEINTGVSVQTEIGW